MENIHQGMIENAIAISACIHGSKRYKEFYDRVASRLNGFTGIYDLCKEMAQIVTAHEQHLGGPTICWDNPENKYDWAELTELYAEAVIEAGINDAHSLNAGGIFVKLMKDATILSPAQQLFSEAEKAVELMKQAGIGYNETGLTKAIDRFKNQPE